MSFGRRATQEVLPSPKVEAKPAPAANNAAPQSAANATAPKPSAALNQERIQKAIKSPAENAQKTSNDR